MRTWHLVLPFVAPAAIAGACTSFEADSVVRLPERDAAPDVVDAPSPVLPDAADASSCACPGRAPCGVRIMAGMGAFCIDPTEVTEGAFAQFATERAGIVDAGVPCEAVPISQRSPS